MSSAATWWNGLSARERLVLGGGGLAAAAIVLYTFAWVPWQAELRRLRAQVPENRATLAWMQDQLGRLGPAAGRIPAAGSDRSLPLLTVVEQSSREAGIRDAVRQIQPGEKGEVNVWLQDAAFDTWVRWVDALRGRDIELTAASVTRAAQEDRVNIRMTMVRYE